MGDDVMTVWLGLSRDVRIGVVLNIKARVADLRDEAPDSPGRREMEAALYDVARALQGMVNL